MDHQRTISEAELRTIVRELLDIDDRGEVYTPGIEVVNVNATVDPQAPDTDPVNPNFTPQNKVEFQAAVRNLVRNLPPGEMPDLYDTLKGKVEEYEEEEEEKMDPTAEAFVRNQVRTLLLSEEEEQPQPMTFQQIADELGFSVAGAKQAVDKALAKAKFVAPQMENFEMRILMLRAFKDYIRHLQSSGELSQGELQFMIDHPVIVTELDGFREFLHNYIRRKMRAQERMSK